MRVWLESMPVPVAAGIFLAGFAGATILVGLLLARIAPREARLQHNDLGGFILAVIGVVYAVLLAFVAFGVWQRFDRAESRVYDEAGQLTVVYRDAGSFGPRGQALRAAIRDYVLTLVNLEWPKMERGESSAKARREIEGIDRQIRALPVTTMSLQNVQAQMLAAIEQSLIDRDARLSMDATGVSGVMWLVLVLGAIVTVGFAYLFGFRHATVQQIMIALLSIAIGLVLFLTFALDFPFRGGVRVPPEAFEHALRVFGSIGS